ncbi:hypothetical protein EDC04DRAFT_287967 [Pisolithus marmoratus]|nr:hypothetical protein EDC04DRAFT_287967 [Pisolithus marmoratus]
MAAILEEGLECVNDEFNALSSCVRMSIQQVIQRFTQQYARSNSVNEWNAHQQYFATHEVRELQRLPGGDDVAGTPSEKMSKCYKLFCGQSLDTYKQILATYKDIVVLANADNCCPTSTVVPWHLKVFRATVQLCREMPCFRRSISVTRLF